MPELEVNCDVRTCPKCNFQALVPDKPPDERKRSMRRRDRKYFLKLAKKLNLPLLDDGTVCPKCGNVATELTEPSSSVHAPQNATIDEVAKKVRPLL